MSNATYYILTLPHPSSDDMGISQAFDMLFPLTNVFNYHPNVSVSWLNLQITDLQFFKASLVMRDPWSLESVNLLSAIDGWLENNLLMLKWE